MEKNIILVLMSFVALVFGQTWVSRARVRDHTNYFTTVMQELAYGLERLGWCNLKLTDVNQDLDLQMYNLRVNGTVLYTNGFLVSIQLLEVVNINQLVTSATVNGTVTPRASVRGRLIMNDATLGYDVIANLTDFGKQRYTGEITLTTITWDFIIIKDLNTGDISVDISSGTAGGLTIRMRYRPENHITEVLSRNFSPANTANGVRSWREKIESILLDILRNRVPFPDICFSDC